MYLLKQNNIRKRLIDKKLANLDLNPELNTDNDKKYNVKSIKIMPSMQNEFETNYQTSPT